MSLIEAARAALEFLEDGHFVYPTRLADDLRTEIAAAEKAEPVAIIIRNTAGQISMRRIDGAPFDMSKHVGGMLYASPAAPAQAPLTDEPWRKLYLRAINEANGLTNYVEDRPELRSAEKRISKIEDDARAIERAHGIGGKA